MTAYPIPDDAIDDRLAFVGTSGSGKTYAMMTAVERLLERKSKVVMVDPLGVAWGIRIKANGKDAAFPVVIFGGKHGDIPITVESGRLIGEAIAGMAESAVVDLSELGSKSNERRFMLGFLEAMYRNASGELFHLIFDEADLWAPQKSLEPQLQNLMERKREKPPTPATNRIRRPILRATVRRASICYAAGRGETKANELDSRRGQRAVDGNQRNAAASDRNKPAEGRNGRPAGMLHNHLQWILDVLACSKRNSAAISV